MMDMEVVFARLVSAVQVQHVLHYIKRWKIAQSQRHRKEAIEKEGDRDEYLALQDVIRVGGASAESAVTAELARLMIHGELVFDSTVEGAPRRLKVDLAERCEDAQQKLTDPQTWWAAQTFHHGHSAVLQL